MESFVRAWPRPGRSRFNFRPRLEPESLPRRHQESIVHPPDLCCGDELYVLSPWLRNQTFASRVRAGCECLVDVTCLYTDNKCPSAPSMLLPYSAQHLHLPRPTHSCFPSPYGEKHETSVKSNSQQVDLAGDATRPIAEEESRVPSSKSNAGTRQKHWSSMS